SQPRRVEGAPDLLAVRSPRVLRATGRVVARAAAALRDARAASPSLAVLVAARAGALRRADHARPRRDGLRPRAHASLPARVRPDRAAALLDRTDPLARLRLRLDGGDRRARAAAAVRHGGARRRLRRDARAERCQPGRADRENEPRPSARRRRVPRWAEG